MKFYKELAKYHNRSVENLILIREDMLKRGETPIPETDEGIIFYIETLNVRSHNTNKEHP